MATVRIGDRDLEVKPITLGFVKHKVLPAKKRVEASTKDEEAIDAMVAFVKIYVGHNEGVTDEWLLDNVPENAWPLIALCRKAGGQPDAPPGEAKSP